MRAGLETFPTTQQAFGVEFNPEHAAQARTAISTASGALVKISEGDFFSFDWNALLETSVDPILVLGNPPWVTNAALGSMQSSNLPRKQNVDSLRGLEAITGSSNFDISEWMLRESLRWLSLRNGMLAVLCKTSVARKVLKYAWSQGLFLESAAIYRIDAKEHFNASVDACLLCARTSPGKLTYECAEYESLDAEAPSKYFAFRDGEIVANVRLYERWRHLHRPGLSGWRSGIKHDCSKVFELEARDGAWINGLGEQVELEEELVFPLLKSSDLPAGRSARKWVFVPQKSMSESPEMLSDSSPRAWEYLRKHSDLLAGRGSSIYKKRPPFSIFGIGPYSFALWKVGISGLYKTLQFVPIGPTHGKPTFVDDTCYLFPSNSQEECEVLISLYESQIAKEFFHSLIFWDAKRPVTARHLNMLDLSALAIELHIESADLHALAERQIVDYTPNHNQQFLFR
jgi:hypothetical protein